MATWVRKIALVLSCVVVATGTVWGGGLREGQQADSQYAVYAFKGLDLSTKNFWNITVHKRLRANQDWMYLGDQACFDPCAVDYSPNKRGNLWVSGNGNWIQQDDDGDVAGYDYDAYGLSMGYEHRFGNFIIGLAAGYDRATTDVNHLETEYKADVLHTAAYAGYYRPNGFFIRFGFGYNHGWNDGDVTLIDGSGTRNLDYDNHDTVFDLETGYVFRTSLMNITPSFGGRYTHSKQGAFTETGPGANLIKRQTYSRDELFLNLRLNRAFYFGACTFIPEFKAQYIYNPNSGRIRSDLSVGVGGAQFPEINIRGTDPGEHRMLLGAGATMQFNQRFDASLNYDLEAASDMLSHNVSFSLGLGF